MEALYKVRISAICDALRNLVSFVQFKKQTKKKNNGGVLLLVSLQLY